jgi:DNA repair protein RecO (recombination protein O)
MSLQKTQAIVLKSQRQGETSKILTVYTRAFGKIKIIAKGARSVRSRFGGSLEPLNYIAMVFYEKETRELQFLSQADIIETFPKINQDLQKTALAMAACELLNQLEVGVAPNPLLFRLLLETLRGINNSDKRPHNCFRVFQVRLLEIFGFKPNLTSCLKCGSQKQDEVLFDVGRGGYICAECQKSTATGTIICKEAINALRAFQRTPFTNLNGFLTSPMAQQQVDALLWTYLRYHLEGLGELKALKFLKKISNKRVL